jgi:hypothetical protein
MDLILSAKKQAKELGGASESLINEKITKILTQVHEWKGNELLNLSQNIQLSPELETAYDDLRKAIGC